MKNTKELTQAKLAESPQEEEPSHPIQRDKQIRLTVGKGRTTRPSEQEEWVREYYEIIVTIDDLAELGVARANLVGLIDGWLTRLPKAPMKAPIDLPPDVDLHDLEHDGGWRSWRKDEEGRCSFPAQEGHPGWLKVSKSGTSTIALVKAMDAKRLEKVSLGLYEYKLSGEDFLQRRPLKKPPIE